MPRTKEQFESIRIERKKQILHTALELFASNGYHSTSISQIAKATKISKGLMYNYFDSKEELLKIIFVDLIETIMHRIDPDNKGSLNQDEADNFIENIFNVLIDNPSDWRLFYQLMLQKEVMQLMMQENLMEKFFYAQQTMFKYFAEREFDDHVMTIMHFSSVYKGFALQYAFAPELFSHNDLEKFKNLLKTYFVKPLKKNGEPAIELNEFLGYLLL